MVGDSSDINESRFVSDFVEHRGFLSAYGSYQIYYESALLKETSPATITWVGTVEGVLVILGGVASGPVYDRGFVRELLLVGSALVVAGIILLSLSTKFYQVLLTQGFCVGIGSDMLYTPSIALVSSCFHKRRAHAICLATCGTAFGGILYPIVFVKLLPRIGFAWTTRVLGLITLVELAIAMSIMIPHTKQRARTSESRRLFDLKALSEPMFAIYCLALFFMWIAYWVPFFIIPSFARYRLGASSTLSFYLLAVAHAATLPGRILAVYASTRYGIPQMLLASSIATGVMLLAWTAVGTINAYIVWISMLGLAMAPLAVLVPAIIPQICPRKEVVGVRMGMAWASASFGVLVGTPVSGKLINVETGSFWKAQVFIGVAMLAGSACVAFLWRAISRRDKLLATRL
ncbi:MFS general substrate transporter [Aureobasidium pullulans]|uniref:MFS general substrate transporter n=1 Tax=Aureobasidium pullulans TaxID=5580 RepID=A0A4S9X156_AURPU|nr:MFS general substrate transporter [Aureobasidium pullulans]